MNKVQCKLLEFGSENYKKSIDLRRQVLRKPLGLDFTSDDLITELDQFHFALFYNNELQAILLLKTMNDNNPGVLKMRQVAVNPEFQSKGFGSILVKFSEQWAIESGYKSFELHARITAVEFYKKLNYEEIGREFLEVNIPHIKMIKNL
jgi:predicted GNAT family N-acyltransferase